MNRAKAVLKTIITPGFWVGQVRALRKGIPAAIKSTYMGGSFFLLLVAFLFGKIWSAFARIPLIGIVFRKIAALYQARFSHLYEGLVNGIEKSRTTQLKRSYLINLAYKNLMVKKTRSFITILGMSVGVGIIVFLLSLGYGIERLIISKVAGLDELKMIDVSTGANTSLRLNGTATDKIKKLQKVDKVVPLISLVGRVSYNNANTDTVVYAASKSYMEIAKLKLLKGTYFSSSTSMLPDPAGQVAGVEDTVKKGTYGAATREVGSNVRPETIAIAWEKCDTGSKFLGYAVRQEGGFDGKEYWGGEYAPFNSMGRAAFEEGGSRYLGLWIKANVPLFSKNADGTLEPQLDETGRHKWESVCLQEKDMQVYPKDFFAQVLGESTGSAELAMASNGSQTPAATESATPSTFDAVVVASGEGGLEVVQLQASGSAATASKKKNDTLKFEKPGAGEAVVSLGFLRLLNIPENKAVGKTFDVQFIVVKNLMPEIEGRVLTTPVKYRITGVTDDADNQYLYIPFTDAQAIGIKNYSQIKVVFSEQGGIEKARKEIETMGFKTNSTGDTIAQIESLFANVRVLLGLLGMVALGVASLGMFNTLTVSLLERTREIGGMKTMGVVSHEIQDLFLAEAMIMGLGGGVGGLVLGVLVGKALSLGISTIAIVNGQGYLSLTYVPSYLVFFILMSSFIVGMITGFYPAQRAKKISALNALRYE